jgi:hypothetical protein
VGIHPETEIMMYSAVEILRRLADMEAPPFVINRMTQFFVTREELEADRKIDEYREKILAQLRQTLQIIQSAND